MAGKWDLTVPDDDAEFLAELRRLGARPGLRLHVEVAAEAPQERRPQDEVPEFFGSFRSGHPDLGERSSEILRAEFPLGQ